MVLLKFCCSMVVLAVACSKSLRGSPTLTTAYPSIPKATLLLQVIEGGKPKNVTDLDKINEILARSRARVTPIPYAKEPESIRSLLSQTSLTNDEQKTVFDHFELNRQQIMDTITAVPGRMPFYAYDKGDGSLTATDYTQQGAVEGQYPTLFHIFDKSEETCQICNASVYKMFHTQVPTKKSGGKGQDEIMQILRGDSGWEWAVVDNESADPVRLMVRASTHQGWKITYPGSTPHVGIIGGSQQNLPYWGVAQIVGGSSFVQTNMEGVKSPYENVPLPF